MDLLIVTVVLQVILLIVQCITIYHVIKSRKYYENYVDMSTGIEYMDVPIHTEADSNTIVNPTEFVQRQIDNIDEEETGIEIITDEDEKEM